jgi:hypothetical protein
LLSRVIDVTAKCCRRPVVPHIEIALKFGLTPGKRPVISHPPFSGDFSRHKTGRRCRPSALVGQNELIA